MVVLVPEQLWGASDPGSGLCCSALLPPSFSHLLPLHTGQDVGGAVGGAVSRACVLRVLLSSWPVRRADVTESATLGMNFELYFLKWGIFKNQINFFSGYLPNL